MSSPEQQQDLQGLGSEIKFLVFPSLADQICDWARSCLAPDPFGSGHQRDTYLTTSIYFDTDDFSVFRRRGSYGRSKYRIRRYGQSDAVFLERKFKSGGLLKKRRSIALQTDLPRLAEGVPQCNWAGFWFHRRLLARELKPICQITYLRTARVADTHYGPIRLTLDREIRAWPANQIAFLPPHNDVRLLETQVVLELKYHFAMPVMFKRLIEEFALNPALVSKYRLAAATLGLVRDASANMPVLEPTQPTMSDFSHTPKESES